MYAVPEISIPPDRSQMVSQRWMHTAHGEKNLQADSKKRKSKLSSPARKMARK